MIGGDMRQFALAERLAREEIEVAMWGCGVDDDKYKLADRFAGVRAVGLSSALGGASVVVLPLPVTLDGIRINCRGEHDLRITELIDALIQMREKCTEPKRTPLLLGGKVPPLFRRLALENNIKIIDYYDREDVQVRNAVPTAEGAVAIAMNELPVTIKDCRAMVLGYGRVGRKLASLLRSVGADVGVSARSERDLAWADVDGAAAISLNELRSSVPSCDVIFNTIPFCILDREMLTKIPTSTLIIDLAGAPGGVDVTAAKELGSNVIWARSLPGKVAPISAGRIIGDAVLKIMSEEGVTL